MLLNLYRTYKDICSFVHFHLIHVYVQSDMYETNKKCIHLSNIKNEFIFISDFLALSSEKENNKNDFIIYKQSKISTIIILIYFIHLQKLKPLKRVNGLEQQVFPNMHKCMKVSYINQFFYKNLLYGISKW